MTTKIRYFLFGSALVFAVGLSIGVVAYYGGIPQGLFTQGPGPEELKYVPADAAVVAYANVRDVMNSELRQRLRQFGGPSDEGRNEIREQTGIDIERDIDHIVAYMGALGQSGHPENGLVLARGTFDRPRLEVFAKEKGARIEDYKGKRLMLPPVKDEPASAERAKRPDLAVAFMEDGLVAMGGLDMVKRAIDANGGGTGVRSNEPMMKLVSEMGDASMWAVGRVDALTAGAKLPDEMTGRIPPLTWFAASGHVNGGVQAMVRAEAKDEAGATNLRDIIRGFTALAKMQAGSRPEAQALWPAIELGGEGKIVSVSFALSSQLLDAMATKHGPGAPPKAPVDKK